MQEIKTQENKSIEEYKFSADGIPVKVIIFSDRKHNVPIYEIFNPEIPEGTKALIEVITDELVREHGTIIEDANNIEKITVEKKRFLEHAEKKLKSKMPELKQNEIDLLAGHIIHRIYGLGEIELLMSDNWLEEIAVNGTRNPISVYHRKYGWCRTTKHLKTEEAIYNISSRIGRYSGREITTLNPIMDSHLLGGDRATSTLYPISSHGNTITIRRFSRNPWTPISLLNPSINNMSMQMAAFIWQAVQYELNAIVIGGTASGKTSMLNALSSFIVPNQRVISIEDTREITLPETLEWNWVPLTTRLPNPENQGAVDMLDLMIASLRMRPDRIIVGEIRKKAHAETLFEAMHTGHSVYATMHADTVSQAIKRLSEPPIEIPQAEIESLHLLISQYRDRRKGIRRTSEIAEIVNSGNEKLDLNYVFRYKPRTDSFEKTSESIRIIEELNLHTGMTPKEISDDLREKESILKWMLSYNISSIHDFGNIISAYYKSPQEILDKVSRNQKP